MNAVQRMTLRTIMSFPIRFICFTLIYMFLPAYLLYVQPEVRNLGFIASIPLIIILSPLFALFVIIQDWHNRREGIMNDVEDEWGNLIDYDA